MKLKEFKAVIAALPEDLDECEVYTTKDDEFNGFNEVYGADTYWARGENSRELEVCGDEDLESEYDEDDRAKFEKIIVI